MRKTNLRRLTMAAMMGAIALVLIFVNFGVPFLSPVAEFDLSALPELIRSSSPSRFPVASKRCPNSRWFPLPPACLSG
jgi:hypothetical protein